jgi:hypothetical protein
MLDNNHNDSTCAFAEQIVSYLYGEINTQEKGIFEAHLNSCQKCADEFAGFSVVHSSVIQWRNEEFLSLETPLIEIPYENTRKIYNLENNPTISRSWFAEFRRLFTHSLALTTSASLALVIICIGIIFFSAKYSNNVELVDKNKYDEKEIISPPFVKEILPGDKSIATVANNGDSNRQKDSVSRDFRKGSIIKAEASSKNYAKNSNQTGNVRIIKATNTGNKTTAFAKAGKTPRLNDVEEEEDKSLRLAELLGDGEIE